MIQDIIDGYIQCAEWVEDEHLSDCYNAEEHARLITGEIESFLDMVTESDIEGYLAHFNYSQMGHDLYLTRCGHGAGFWDRGLGKLGDRLTQAAESLGNDDHIYQWCDL